METSNQNPNFTTFQELYAQFYESVNALTDQWFGLTETEKAEFIKANKIDNLDNIFEWIDNACNSARELPKEVTTIDDAKGEIAMYMLKDAIVLLNFVDKFGCKLNDYMFKVNEM